MQPYNMGKILTGAALLAAPLLYSGCATAQKEAYRPPEQERTIKAPEAILFMDGIVRTLFPEAPKEYKSQP